MRDGIEREMRRAKAEKLQLEREQRLAKVAVIVHLAKQGQMAVGRALEEIIETARGDADPIVRVGKDGGYTPEVQT